MEKISLICFLFLSVLFSCKKNDTTDIYTGKSALDFNPAVAGQQVKIENITCPQELTIEAWVYFKNDTLTYPTIFEFGNDAPFVGLHNLSGEYYLTLYPIVLDVNPLPLNKWVHIAATYSTSGSIAKLYVNGVLVATQTNKILKTSGTGAGIGYNGTDAIFNGSIDEVRVWNVVRTDSEIQNNMYTTFKGNEAGIYAYYNFDEGKGNTVNDLSPNNFDGTLTNMNNSSWIKFDSSVKTTK